MLETLEKSTGHVKRLKEADVHEMFQPFLVLATFVMIQIYQENLEPFVVNKVKFNSKNKLIN